MQQVCDAKSLNAFDDSFSLFLYTNVNYLYRLGMGEAYMVIARIPPRPRPPPSST